MAFLFASSRFPNRSRLRPLLSGLVIEKAADRRPPTADPPTRRFVSPALHKTEAASFYVKGAALLFGLVSFAVYGAVADTWSETKLWNPALL